MAAKVGVNGMQLLESTQKWATVQAEIASRLARDLDSLRDSMLELEQNLNTFASSVRPSVLPQASEVATGVATGTPTAEVEPEASTHLVTTAATQDARTKPAGASTSLDVTAVATSSLNVAGPDFFSVLASKPGNHAKKGRQQIFQKFATAVGEKDFIGDVDYTDVITLLQHMVRQHDIRERNRRNARLSSLHCLGIEPERSGVLARVVQSRWFQLVVALVIVMNAIFIGYSMEVSIRDPGRETDQDLEWPERVFLAFFSLELIARLAVHRLHFFVNHDWQWNILDFTLVILSLQNVIFRQDALTVHSGPRITFVRILRLSRVTRMFRIFRVMVCFRELRILWRCMSGSMRSMLWSVVMMAMFYYIFAVIFMNGVVSHAASDAPESEKDEVSEVCGSVFICMQSLYKASTGGADWENLADPLKKVGGFYYGTFLFFIAFAFIAVLNVVTGIFVNDAIQASKGDAQESILAYMEDVKQFEETLRTLFSEMDIKGDRSLSSEDFCLHMRDGAHWAYFCTLGLDISDCQEFFALLCEYLQQQELSEDGFVSACRRFRANAKYSDIILLRTHLNTIETQLKGLQDTWHSNNHGHGDETPQGSRSVVEYAL